MQLILERPDYEFFLRRADGRSALVNERTLDRSFIIAPNTLIQEWPVRDALRMVAADLDSVLALMPELVVLGTGAVQVFPPAEVMAACLTRGIGIEIMDNAAAARTFNVLAGEGRRVVAGFVIVQGEA
jgi:uncharacterized protein